VSKVQRVLVCDDSLTIRRLCSMVATNLGITLDLAVNAAEGVSKARQTRPDLLLLDYVLPDGKGQDVLDQLAQNEATAGIPVVMMSAKGESLVGLLGNRAAVVGFLNKPFKPQDLEQLLRSHAARPSAAVATRNAAPAADAPSVAPSLLTQAEGLLHKIDDQALAKLVFKVLRAELGRVAEWLTGAGVQADVGELARRLIKPSVVRDLRHELEQACPTRSRAAKGLFDLCRGSVAERVPGFSSRVVGTPLRDQERGLLGLVDGTRTIGDIERELQWTPAEVANVLDSVAGLGLLRLRTGLCGGSRPGTLWLVDDLPGEFAADLAQHLGRYGRRWTIVRMRAGEAADEAQRSTPDGILVRCTGPDQVAALRAIPNFDRLPITAIYDDSLMTADALLGAGADQALPLPVRTGAIDSFLGSMSSTARGGV
jgi:twitching motility two-component system response regulator PilH